MIRGIGTSKGIGIGNALLIDIDNPEIKVVKVEDTQAEKERFKAAVEEFCNTTQSVTDELESKLKGSNNTALVMRNQIYLIKDPEMIQGVNSLIDKYVQRLHLMRPVRGLSVYLKRWIMRQ